MGLLSSWSEPTPVRGLLLCSASAKRRGDNWRHYRNLWSWFCHFCAVWPLVSDPSGHQLSAYLTDGDKETEDNREIREASGPLSSLTPTPCLYLEEGLPAVQAGSQPLPALTTFRAGVAHVVAGLPRRGLRGLQAQCQDSPWLLPPFYVKIMPSLAGTS